MDKHYYNLEKIIKIKLIEKEECTDYHWQEEIKKTFWNKGRKAGLYKPWYTDDYKCYGDNDLPNELYLENKKVYFRPHAEIHFQDDYKKTTFFQLKEEAQEFINKIIEQSGQKIQVIEK